MASLICQSCHLSFIMSFIICHVLYHLLQCHIYCILSKADIKMTSVLCRGQLSSPSGCYTMCLDCKICQLLASQQQKSSKKTALTVLVCLWKGLNKDGSTYQIVLVSRCVVCPTQHLESNCKSFGNSSTVICPCMLFQFVLSETKEKESSVETSSGIRHRVAVLLSSSDPYRSVSKLAQ